MYAATSTDMPISWATLLIAAFPKSWDVVSQILNKVLQLVIPNDEVHVVKHFLAIPRFSHSS